MAKALELHDAGLTEREIAEYTETPKTTVHRLINQGPARRYGMGQVAGELNHNCHSLEDEPPMATIDPEALEDMSAEDATIM